MRPSGMSRAPDVPGPLKMSTRPPRETCANGPAPAWKPMTQIAANEDFAQSYVVNNAWSNGLTASVSPRVSG